MAGHSPSHDAEVFELPRVFFVNVLAEQSLSFEQRGPVSVLANDRYTVRVSDLENSLPVHLVWLDNPTAWVFHGPDHPGEGGCSHLERRCRVVFDELPGVLDLELRTIPVCPFGVTAQEYTELVNALGDFVNHQPLFLLLHVVLASKLVQREHGIIARMVCVVHRRAIYNLVTLLHGEVVRNRDGLVVGDQEAVKGSLGRGPRPHLGGAARAVEKDCRIGTELVVLAINWKVLLVGSPAKFGRLTALADEAIDTPSVDKLSGLLWLCVADLRVPLRDVDRLDPELLCERPPPRTGGRLGNFHASVLGNVKQGALDVVRH
mmetsp:Transcript_18660/g.48629  ORF Transcript_18660/g.48629 Transcript_18660/m.48629 type:complete len:319 (+) Transcript_18660:112-1068(+)